MPAVTPDHPHWLPIGPRSPEDKRQSMQTYFAGCGSDHVAQRLARVRASRRHLRRGPRSRLTTEREPSLRHPEVGSSRGEGRLTREIRKGSAVPAMADYVPWARSLATVTLAALGGPLPAAATAALGEVVRYALQRYESDSETRNAQKQVELAIREWATSEQLALADAKLGLELATRIIARFGATDEESAEIDYDPTRATNLVLQRASLQDNYWGTEPHYEVARRAIGVAYGELYAQLRANNRVLLPAVSAVRGEIRTYARQLENLGGRVEARLEAISNQLDTLPDRLSPAGDSNPRRVRTWPDVMPAKNVRFVGRQAELGQLETGFTSNGLVTVQTVRGMGGVGKTQLAAEFTHTHAADYELVWWVPATKAVLIAQSARRMLAALGIEAQYPNDEEAMRAMQATLAGATSWLLIFDNAEELNTIQKWLPTMPQQPGARQHVLVTTRRGGYASVGSVFEVDVWTLEEAASFLVSRLPGVPGECLSRLAVALGRLPLALEQAAAYVTATAIDCADYVTLFEERRSEMLSRGAVSGHEAVVATLWDLSLAAIEQRDLAAMGLIEMCAYLSNTAIPLDLFAKHGGRLPDRLRARLSDPVLLNDAVGTLLDYSMCTRNGREITFHLLTQAAVRARHDLAGETQNEALPFVLRLLRKAFPVMVLGKSEVWSETERWSILLPHVLAAVNSYLTQTRSNPAIMRMCLDLLATAINYSRVRGDYAEALELAERARVAMESFPVSGDDRWRAGRLADSAIAFKDIQAFDRALPLAQSALRTMRAATGDPLDLDVAIDTALVAKILFDPRPIRRSGGTRRRGIANRHSRGSERTVPQPQTE